MPFGKQIELDRAHQRSRRYDIQALDARFDDIIGQISFAYDRAVDILFALCVFVRLFLFKKGNGQVQLHIPVDHQHFFAFHSKRATDIRTRRSLAAAAFVVCKCNYDGFAHIFSCVLLFRRSFLCLRFFHGSLFLCFFLFFFCKPSRSVLVVL